MKESKNSKYGIGAVILDCIFTIEALANICAGQGTALDYGMLFIFAFIVILLICEKIIKR